MTESCPRSFCCRVLTQAPREPRRSVGFEVEALRYVAYFGATAQEAAAATSPELSFMGDFGRPNRVGAFLGHDRTRVGTGFSRPTLCFAIAAVDEAANVGERSDAVCVDTIDEKAATTTMVDGAPCTLGCAGCRWSRQGP